MKTSLVVVLVLILGSFALWGAPAGSPWLGMIGLGSVGGLAGAAVALTAIGEWAPHMESRFGSTMVVIASLTVFDGLGAAAGVLVAGKLWDLEGDLPGCLIGGAVGGLVSAFVEPFLYLVGVPEGVAEFLGLALLPILPAIGAAWGFH